MMRSAARPKRYKDSCARMFVAVAAASLRTMSAPRTMTSANTPMMIVIKYKTPAILAHRRGDVSTTLSITLSLAGVHSPRKLWSPKSGCTHTLSKRQRAPRAGTVEPSICQMQRALGCRFGIGAATGTGDSHVARRTLRRLRSDPRCA